MATFSYPFEPGGPERVTVTTGMGFRGATVAVDGVPVGGFPNRKSFQAGAVFPMKAGGELQVQFKRGFLGNNLTVFYQGRPLHVLGKKPPLSIQSAGSIVLAIGILTLIPSGIFLAQALSGSGTALAAAIPLGFAVAFIIMGIFVRKGSFAALIVATVFYAIDMVMFVFLIITAGQPPALIAVGIKVLFLLALINGLTAFKEMRKMQAIWQQWQMQDRMAAGGAKPVPLAEKPPQTDPPPPAPGQSA